jgi:tRNA(Ile)-lysidine synthase
VTAQLSANVSHWLDRHGPTDGAIAIGYSGGGDSHALLCLTLEWANKRGVSVLALIVDHGLRAESAQEAGVVMRAACLLGAKAKILPWSGVKPQTGIQAAARQARHGLLAEACAAAGIEVLLLAHNLEDQAETVWMRLRAGGDWRSCIGMTPVSPSPIWPEGRNLTLLKPLLSTRRDSLRSYLRDKGETWIEDPSNDDLRFTRIATRQRLALLEGAGFDQARLSNLSHQLLALDGNERRLTAASIGSVVTVSNWGGIAVDVSVLKQLSLVLQLRLVRAAIRAVSGRPRAPRGPVCCAMLRAMLGRYPATGGGAQLIGKQDQIWLIRDQGDILGRVDRPVTCTTELVRGESTAWDGRYEIETSLDGIRAEPLGVVYEGLDDRSLIDSVPGRARPGLLVFRKCGTVLAIAGILENSKIDVRSLIPRRLDLGLLPYQRVGRHQVRESAQ